MSVTSYTNGTECIVPLNCSEVNTTTCDYIPTIHNWDVNDPLYDEDGCFNKEKYYVPSRTLIYHQYIQFVSFSIIGCGSMGFFGNILSILVLSRKEMKNCFSEILITLNICDSVHILFSIMETLNNTFSLYPQFLLQIFPLFHYPMYRMSLCASIFLLIGIGIERYLAVCRPHHYHSVQDQQNRSLYYILPSLLAALLLNIPRFFDTEVYQKCFDFTECGCPVMAWQDIRLTSLRKQWEYQIIYHTWIWNMFTGILPLFSLIFLNTNIYLAMRRMKENLERGRHAAATRNGNEESIKKKIRQQSKDCNLSVILIFTILMFLVCHIPRIVSSCVEAYAITSTLECESKNKGFLGIWYMYIQHLVQLLMLVNSSVNLPIYLCCSTQFKSTLQIYVDKFKPNFVGSNRNLTPATASLIEMNDIQTQI